MIKKVSVEHLKIGVYIDKIDKSWFSTPFFRHEFKITTEKQIQTLRNHGIKEVSIDDQKGLNASDASSAEKHEKSIAYLPVSVDHLVLNTLLPFELFVLKEKEQRPYLGKNFPFHSEVKLDLDDHDLNDLAIGGILHDVGKSKVPASLINKPGKLTDKEFSEVKNHVTRGYLILKEHQDLPKRAIFPLLQHHEKLNGKGYPHKLQGDEIHLFGRMASIVDIYDALTTKRAYKKAFSPFDALNFLGKQGEAYDPVIFKAFVEMISQ